MRAGFLGNLPRESKPHKPNLRLDEDFICWNAKIYFGKLIYAFFKKKFYKQSNTACNQTLTIKYTFFQKRPPCSMFSRTISSEKHQDLSKWASSEMTELQQRSSEKKWRRDKKLKSGASETMWNKIPRQIRECRRLCLPFSSSNLSVVWSCWDLNSEPFWSQTEAWLNVRFFQKRSEVHRAPMISFCLICVHVNKEFNPNGSKLKILSMIPTCQNKTELWQASH